MSYRCGGLGTSLRVVALGLLGFLALGCGDDDSGNTSDMKPDSGDGEGKAGNGGKGGTGGTDHGTTGKADAGGTGGSGAKPDAGPTDVDCDTVDNACTKDGTSCDGDTLVTCAEDDNGCLVETYKECAQGATDFCDSDLSMPACAMDPCSGVRNACTTAGKTCNGTDLIQCAKNADGCLVNTTIDCTDGDTNTCSTAAGRRKAECVTDVCKDKNGKDKENVCVENAASCAGDVLVTCKKDKQGCPIAKRTDCADPDQDDTNFCDDSGDSPECAKDPCIGVTQCLTAGVTCDGVNRVECKENNSTDHCLILETTNCVDPDSNPETPPLMQTCDPDTHACAACVDACPTAGVKTCGGAGDNILTTCMVREGEFCRSLVEQDCGPMFDCNTDDGCVFGSDDACDGPDGEDPIEQVLVPGTSTAQIMTAASGNDFNGYRCPGLGTNGLAAQAPDKLFALDVPGKSVAIVTIGDLSGFASGQAPWLLLLTKCKDNGSTAAEASCTSLSRTSVTYANESATPVRVYITVDASLPNGGAANVGTFSLSVDSRVLKCGDGFRDGTEQCDDGNLLDHDGCTPDCELEDLYTCTSANPSVCTLRPETAVCANVMCPPLDPSVPNGTAVCCTVDQTCGVAYAPVYGAGCVEREAEGAADTECPNATGPFAFITGGDLTGCCRPDHKCGLLATIGGGCTERTEVWRDMEDGYGRFLFTGPFLAKSCTP
jgi:cysteine-rich repeat protein